MNRPRPEQVAIVVAVEREAEAVERHLAGAGVDPGRIALVVGGVGRTNAAIATVVELASMDACAEAGAAALSVGVAGAYASDDAPAVGSVVVATLSIYAEEGIETPSGFGDMRALGFPLGDFEGNAVPADPGLLGLARTALPHARFGPIATVATCAGTDARAAAIAARTGAVAEAMEGAAVLHAARRLSVPALELRGISNTTGDRDRQTWDLDAGLDAAGGATAALVRTLLAD